MALIRKIEDGSAIVVEGRAVIHLQDKQGKRSLGAIAVSGRNAILLQTHTRDKIRAVIALEDKDSYVVVVGPAMAGEMQAKEFDVSTFIEKCLDSRFEKVEKAVRAKNTA